MLILNLLVLKDNKMVLSEAEIQKEIDMYFHFISLYYTRESNFSLTAGYQFRFSHEGKNFDWYLTVNKEEIYYGQGLFQNPDLIISTPLSLWFQISSRKKNATLEYFKKAYTIEGPLRILLKFNVYFGSITKKSRLKLENKPDPWEIAKKRNWQKPEKILVINASPRMKKGFTYRYLNPFIEGMSQHAKNIEIIDLYKSEFKIEPCRGCEYCWRESEKCILHDDSDMLIKKVLDSRMTVFAMPLYIDSLPAKLKALLDRFFIQTKPEFETDSSGRTRHPIIDQRERYFTLFAVCGFPEMAHLKPLENTFKQMGRNFHAPVIANILRPGSQFLYINPLLLFERKKVEQELFKAGEQLVTSGKIRKKRLKAISNIGKVPMTEWRYYTNMYWAFPPMNGNQYLN